MVTIRKAIPSDNGACCALVKKSLAHFQIQANFEVLDAVAGQFGLNNVNNAVELVADVDGQLVACLMIHPVCKEVAKVFGFHVQIDYQGNGIGKKMLKAAVSECTQLGFSTIKLDTCERMQIAVKLYETTGWKRDVDPLPDSGADRTYFLSLMPL